MEDWELDDINSEHDVETIEESDNTQENKFLTFYLGNEAYGIEIQKVIEIVEIQKITRVPETLPFIKGVMNLRGNVIPVMDLRLRFNMAETAYTDRTCVIIVSELETTVGLIIDSVSEVMEILNKNIDPILERQNGMNQFVKGIGKANNQIKMLIDLNKLLFEGT